MRHGDDDERCELTVLDGLEDELVAVDLLDPTAQHRPRRQLDLDHEPDGGPPRDKVPHLVTHLLPRSRSAARCAWRRDARRAVSGSRGFVWSPPVPIMSRLSVGTCTPPC